MKQEIKIKTGKIIEVPSRMFKKEDIVDMGISYVEKKTFFNKSKYNETAGNVSREINDNMVVIDYYDCSAINFSAKILSDVAQKQLSSTNDLIILPTFKNESEYDTRKKIVLAGLLKTKTDKEIILEISYKSGIPDKELAEGSSNFDYLALFYGVHFGHYPSFRMLCHRMLEFKKNTGKKVFCTAVPMMFAGDSNDRSVYFVPLWSLISDVWIRNWRQGGSNGKVRLVDPNDRKNKEKVGWLEAGHRPDEIIPQVNVTVHEIFRTTKEMERTRETYKQLFMDEILTEIGALTPATIENYVWQKFPSIYQYLVIGLYREKFMIRMIREADWLQGYSQEERYLLEGEFRKAFFNPALLEKAVIHIKSLVEKDSKISALVLIDAIKSFREPSA